MTQTKTSGRHRLAGKTVAQAVDAGMDVWRQPGEDDTQRLTPLPVLVQQARAVVALRHPERPLVIDRDVPLPSGVGVYQHRPSWSERRDAVAITLLIALLWLLLMVDDGSKRRVWGETRPAWEQRTRRSPAALATIVHGHHVPEPEDDADDLAEVDLTEAEVDAMVAEGEPVEVAVPAAIADALELEMPVQSQMPERFTETWQRMTPEFLAELDAKRSATAAA